MRADAVGLSEDALEELRELLGEDRVLTSPEELICHSFDATSMEHRPDAVVLARSTDDVVDIVRVAHRERIPVIPRGAGTGLAGGTVPIEGGIVLTLDQMKELLEIDIDNLVAVVQPGVVTEDLQRTVEAKGLFYPPDPSSLTTSTLGGNVAANAGGPRGVKYGVTGDYVLGLEVVLADGRVLRTGGKRIKDVTGYDLTSLFVGSEGTLGVITEITFRLLPLPPARRAVMAVFPRIEEAGQTASRIIARGIIPAAMEIMDKVSVRCVESYLKMGLPVDADAILLIQMDDEEEVAERHMVQVAEICRECGADRVELAHTDLEIDALWVARRSVTAALAAVRPHKIGEDISVPRSQVAPMIVRIGEISRKHDLPIAIFGHAGDGNLHPNVLFDRRAEDEVARAYAAVGDIFQVAIALGGTLSGEHGVGLSKGEYLELGVGPLGVELMRAIKNALDPKGILNPGKIFAEA